jgi:mono/diheme cytochrome c family protein
MRSPSRSLAWAPALAAGLVACSSAPTVPPAPQLEIVTTSGAPLHAVAGDALSLKVVEAMPDGSTKELSAGATVVWSLPDTVTTLPPESTGASPLPAPGPNPTGAWIDNVSRPDRAADLEGVLFILDPGTVQNATLAVSATVSGGALPGSVLASIDVDPTLGGVWTRGAALYGAGGANCAACHGPTGHGSPGAPEATSYSISGGTYDFPAPGINAEPGNLADDPAWNAALLAVAARADMDNGGVSLRLPMADWLATPNPATGAPLTTQDFADIYAFLKTQTQ